MQFFVFAVNRVGEGKLHADRFADPVFLHAADLFRPAFKRVKVFQEFISVLSDSEVIAGNFTFFNNSTGAPTATIDNLFVGQDGLINRVPVNDLGLSVADALFQHFQEHPLVPAIVLRRTCGYFTTPVKCKTQRLHLVFHFCNVVKSPLGRSNAMVNGGVFCR